MAKHSLKGSDRKLVPGAVVKAKADPAERLEVTVLVRRRAASALRNKVKKLASGRPEGHLRREEFAKQFGAAPADIALVRRFARAQGLAVVQEDPARRTVVLSGTVANMNEAFGVDLMLIEHSEGSFRGRVGPVRLPAELRGVVEAVLGLDNRPQAMPHFRVRAPLGDARSRSGAAPPPSSFTPPQLGSLYRFPEGTGQGECVAIIELGGGFRPADLGAYFATLQIATPEVVAVSVDHGKNHPSRDPNGPDGEVMLDIEVAGAIAPGARLVVYFAPNTDAGFLDAVTTAVHDTVNRPSIISISWGGPESTWTSQAMSAFDDAFQAAAAMGITVCVASGDNGSNDGVGDGTEHVDFPSSSPFALACGGTSLTASDGAIAGEVVWNDGAQGGASGGGVSNFFALPAWQTGLNVTRNSGSGAPLGARGVPDVAGDADPQTGYNVRVDGTDTVIGGTSAVAPLWAGLIVRLNAARGTPIGYLNPALYQNGSAFNDITAGNNGDFSASTGWDACTGLGSPNGVALAAAFPSALTLPPAPVTIRKRKRSR